jgi:hypothetical protein
MRDQHLANHGATANASCLDLQMLGTRHDTRLIAVSGAMLIQQHDSYNTQGSARTQYWLIGC